MTNKTLLAFVATLIIGFFIGHVTVTKNTSPETGSMHHAMNSMTSELQGKTGDDFDKAFLSEMVVHHEGAVAMAEAALKNTKRKEIQDLAGAIISAQEKEIVDMKTWYKAWYGSDLK